MPNELNIGLTTGRTITARLILDGAYVGSAITCTEAPASSGHYSGNVPGGTAAGLYSVIFLEGSTLVGTGALLWDGTAERTALDLPTVAQLNARTLPSADYFNPATDAVATVTSLTNAVTLPSIPANWITAAGLAADAVAEIQSGFPTGGGLAQETLDTIAAILGHTSYLANAVEARDTDTDISSLLTSATYTASLPANFGTLDINASGHIERVVLVDTTTTNSDMRGTDGALTSIGNVTVGGYASGQSPADLVTGFATPANVTDARDAILLQGNSAWTTYDGTDTPGTTTLLDRLSTARAGYLDKLNVSGTLAHSDAAATYRADVSGLLTTATYTSSLPTNFADLAIAATTGLVTTTNPGGGATAAQIWAYSGRSIDGDQATALTAILENTSTTIPGLIAALPTVAQVEAAGFTVTRHNALISAESAALAVADGRHLINYSASTATQYNTDGNVRKVFDLYDVDGNLATSPETAVDRRPRA